MLVLFLLTISCSAALAASVTKLEAQTIGIQTRAPIPLKVPVGKSIPCEVFAPVYQGRVLVIPERAPCTLKVIPTPAQYSDPRYAGTVQLDSITIDGNRYQVRSSREVVVPQKAGWRQPFEILSDVDLSPNH